jgi:2,4-dienoyl-CoA reductase-like NADH-dependent reductase (Old Yellow Enzyme family)
VPEERVVVGLDRLVGHGARTYSTARAAPSLADQSHAVAGGRTGAIDAAQRGTYGPAVLFEPLTFRGGAVAPNRIALAPMTNQQSRPDGLLGEDELAWIAARVDGGFGIIETCAAFVAQDGKAWPGELGVHDDACLPGLRRLAGRIRDGGGLGIVQIFHGGVRAPREVSGSQPWSATTWHEDTAGFEDPRPATEADLERVIGEFAAAARRCLEAGFTGVELHGAHGYLLSQFLSRTMNTRTDGWGGSPAARMRLIRETTRAVRAAVPASFLVGVRLSPEDFGQARGIDLDETVAVARGLCDDGVDFLHLSLWKALDNTRVRPAQHAIPLFRAAVPADVRLFAAGSIWTQAEAEQVLTLGADVVALGRSAITNPDWPRRVIDPAWTPLRPPVTAQQLLDRALSPQFVEYMRRWKNFVA